MWSSVQTSGKVTYDRGEDKKFGTPSARSKHAMCAAEDGHIYLMGGKSANRPLNDIWQLDPGQNEWEEIKCKGDHPPSLQEHTITAWDNKLYIFGGEIGFSSINESPLWILDLATCTYKRLISSPINSKSASSGMQPSGRRGHSAVLYKDALYVYGGYQDLKGSLSELWILNLRSEQWDLMSCSNRCLTQPSPRHSHSAVVHQDFMWIYGGMTDLEEKNDLWKWSFVEQHWTKVKCNKGPGRLHAHTAIKVFDSMFIFGGEREGKLLQELWKYHFDFETWEKIQIDGILPNPRSRHTAIVNPFFDSLYHQKYKKQNNKNHKNHFISDIFSIRNSSKSVPSKSISMCFGQANHTPIIESSKPNKPSKLKHSMSINLCSKLTNTISDEEDSKPTCGASFDNHTHQVKLRKSFKDKIVRSRLVKSFSSSNYNILQNHHHVNTDTKKQETEKLIEPSTHSRTNILNAFTNSAKNNRKSSEKVSSKATLSQNALQKSLSSSPVLDFDFDLSASQVCVPEKPCLKERPMSEVVNGMPGIEDLLEAIEDLHWPSENILKRHSVHESMSYYSLCFPSPPASDRISPSSPNDDLVNNQNLPNHNGYVPPETLRGFLEDGHSNRHPMDSNGNFSGIMSPPDTRSKSSGYNSLLTLSTPSVESRDMPHLSSHCSGYQSFTDETFYDPKEASLALTHTKMANTTMPRRFCNRIQKEPSFELKALNPINNAENNVTGGINLRFNNKDIRARSAFRNSGNFSYRGSNCENGLWAEENIIKEVEGPSSPVLQNWSYNPSKNKLHQSHWQLCMYVFGGREEGVSCAYRQPISVWKLYI